MKKCRKCGEEKPPELFYPGRRPGLLSARCRSCHGLVVKPCNVCGAEFEGQASRRFCSPECRKVARPRTSKSCRWCGQEFVSNHSAQRLCSLECKAKAQETGRRKKFVAAPEARRAQRRVAYAIETGRLVRPVVCEACGTEAKAEAAHRDYARPLDVRWLCRSCHVKWDRAMPKGGGISVAI